MISHEDITCFNLDGTNWDGQPVEFQVDVPYTKVQALWCGLQIPGTVRGGKYKGTVTVTAFSRWINYYLEGLRWMFENYEIFLFFVCYHGYFSTFAP